MGANSTQALAFQLKDTLGRTHTPLSGPGDAHRVVILLYCGGYPCFTVTNSYCNTQFELHLKCIRCWNLAVYARHHLYMYSASLAKYLNAFRPRHGTQRRDGLPISDMHKHPLTLEQHEARKARRYDGLFLFEDLLGISALCTSRM